LQVSPSHDARRLERPWWREYSFAIRLVLCFLCVILATVAVTFLEREGGGANLIWCANGLLLTYLLLAPRWRWPGYLTVGVSAMVVGSAIIGEPWRTNLLYNGLNLIEIMIGALLLRRKSTQLPRFTDRRYLVQFIGFAVLAGPVIAGSILSLIMSVWRHAPVLKTLLDWVSSDGLGAAIVVPTFGAIFQTRFRDAASLRRHWFYPFVISLVTLVAFSQNNTPCLILILPLLVLLLMRLGLGGAALATLLIATTASWFTLHGFGPFAISQRLDSVESSIQLQFFVACCIFLIYIVSVLLEDRNAIEHRLQEIAAIHALVTENSRDVILLADLDGRRTYVSPAVERMKGFKPEELISQKLSDLVHPADREKVEETVRQLRLGTEGANIEYRAQTRNGDYIWVDASLRMFRDRKTGIPAGILSLIRDITERKRNEDLLLKANESLEKLAIVDALTGVANRRRFDECLAHEWSRSARLCEPISLLLIDADSFKLLNDSLGHLAGDRCLKRIAESALEAAMRPSDLVARFGGDEFVVILPNTDSRGAEEVGRQIGVNLRRRNAALDEIAEGLMTISVGCATVIPKPDEQAATLIQIADEGLYNAKRNGRDQLCNSLIQPISLAPGAWPIADTPAHIDDSREL
jgi:diguanylate cyclase (GGDEF)-like protein/PAS domain S-box-containing protein